LNTFSYLGTWDPNSAAYPAIAVDVNSGYYFVTGAGEFDGYTYSIGDWLAYVEDPESNTAVSGRWYRLSGGIIQVTAITSDHGLTNPGVYTKVTVDAHGYVTNGTILSSGDIPSHNQLAETISNFTTKAKEAIGEMIVNAQSQAVTLIYDPLTLSISGDVKIDGNTIQKDQYGQLSVIAVPAEPDPNKVYPPEDHTHPTSEVVDFTNTVKTTVGGMIANTVANAVQLTYNSSTKTLSADLKIDGVTLQKNQYGQIEIAAIPATPNLSEQYPPTPHTHETTDIISFFESVRSVLGLAVGGTPVLVNTPITNAVVFKYDLNTLTISGDVKVDDITITKNIYGQLTVLRPEGPVEEEPIDVINNMTFTESGDAIFDNFLDWIIT
jgi:hypothetical protein